MGNPDHQRHIGVEMSIHGLTPTETLLA
jgi:hypothetical protein